MRVTRRELGLMLEVVLLNEIFNTKDVYPFEKIAGIGDVDYRFMTKDGLEYIVSFEKGYFCAIDISFWVNHEDADMKMRMRMTNMFDLKVYSTVAAVARYFDETEFLDEDKTYAFEPIEEFKGDNRRERVYLYILKKNGFSTFSGGEEDKIYFESEQSS